MNYYNLVINLLVLKYNLRNINLLEITMYNNPLN